MNRQELIARLRDYERCTDKDVDDAADMLEADAQRPPLTDDEIDELAEWHALDFMTYMPFARAIEKKVRGEA